MNLGSELICQALLYRVLPQKPMVPLHKVGILLEVADIIAAEIRPQTRAPASLHRGVSPHAGTRGGTAGLGLEHTGAAPCEMA